MSDNEDVQLPVPSRSLVSAASVGGGGGGGGRSGGLLSGFGTLSSRKVVGALGSTKGHRAGGGSRRLNYAASFASTGGSYRAGGEIDSSAGIGGGGGGSKACTACGIQFTWRMRRHHCRACKKVRMIVVLENAYLSWGKGAGEGRACMALLCFVWMKGGHGT